MSSDATLTRLAESSSEAVVGILEMFAPGQVQAGDVAVLESGAHPLEGMPFPAVATNVSYVDGVTGGNVFVMTLEGARRLAAAMMGASEPDPATEGATELSELEASAASEAMNPLTKGGHDVVGEAGNGVEAISQYQALKPEVMTLDITMPEKDGLAALKEIIALDPAARVIMCSALGQESKVLESIKAGAKDFVVKPFQPDRVIEAVGKALA
jgi:two-component system chemotaxis response regulator CheY